MLEKFLEAYKELEQILREDNVSVLDYENSLSEADKEKLKVCRIIRNYASHNDKKFVTCTKEQIKFLEELKIVHLQDKDIVGNYFTKLPLTQNKMQDVVTAIQKKKYARIDLGIVDATTCIKYYGKRKITKCLDLQTVDVNDRIRDLCVGLYAVKRNGKLVGIIEKR